MKNSMKIIAIVAAFTCATASFAQTGSRIRNTRTVETPEAGQRFADCIADWKTPESEAFLATAPGTPAAEDSMETLLPFRENRCIQFSGIEIGGRTMMIDPALLRGQISQARYLARYPRAAPASIASAPPSEIAVEVYNQRISTAADQRAEILSIFGDCVAAAEPMKVDTLVRTSVASDGESAAIGALSGVFGPCLWQGQSIEFSRESLRTALAAALYRKSEGRTVMALTEGAQARIAE